MELKEKKKISEDLGTSKENSCPVTLDLIPDILKASTVETLARFLCVSKEYKSIIRNQDFMKSYLTKSLNRPQSLIFTFKGESSLKHFFFSASPPQNQGESSLSSVATYHMKCHSQPYTTFAPSVHGLICYGPPSKLKIYNPSTRKTITLPKIDSQRIDMHHYLGYDPIDGDYKVLCMVKDGINVGIAQELRVLKLGNGNYWRMIEDFPPHYIQSPNSVCIDGVLYYLAFLETDKSHAAVISFDIRSEKLNLINGLELGYAWCQPHLTNYEGKLAVLISNDSCKVGFSSLWVLEDAVKQEWSKNVYVLPIINGKTYCFNPFCATNEGEIVLAQEFSRARPYYVLYYHPKKNSMRRVYVEGIREITDPLWDKDVKHNPISVFSGHVDNLLFL